MNEFAIASMLFKRQYPEVEIESIRRFMREAYTIVAKNGEEYFININDDKTYREMKKFITALELFTKKYPDVEVESIKRTSKNYFMVTPKQERYDYSVNLSTNKVQISYPDPDW